MQLKKQLLGISLLTLSAAVAAQAPVEDINDRNRGYQSAGGMNEELFQQLQQLQQEIMSLRGTVEEQGHQIRQLKQQGLDRYIDMDRRISALSGSPAQGPADMDSSPVSSPEGDTGDVSIQANVAAGAEVPTAAAAAATSGTSAAANALTGSPSQDYANAYELVKARQYAAAIEAYKGFVERYPNDRYTPNAWYWLGELYIAVSPKNLVASTQAFQTLLADYPDNGKVPAAMYKLGTVYFIQGEKDKAKTMLTHVIDRYGKTGNSAVIKAREFLRQNY